MTTTPQIEWYERAPDNPRPGYDARIGLMQIASVVQHPFQATGWWVRLYLAPLPNELRNLIPLNPASKRDAQEMVEHITARYFELMTAPAQKKKLPTTEATQPSHT